MFYGYGDEGEEEVKTLNIELLTGQEIPFEKVFVSSAPINLYLSNALYENLAWDIDYEDVDDENEYENWQTKYDMQYRDTSEYEEIFLKLINKYKKEKNNIKYVITPQNVRIYELGDEFTKTDYYLENIEIDFLDYINEVAIYKRYLTKESLFENDNIGQKELLVLTNNILYNNDEYMRRIYYGNIENNIFLEESVEGEKEIYEKSFIKKYIENISKENKSNLRNTIKSNQGAICQTNYYLHEYIDEYYLIYEIQAIVTCDKEYYENNLFYEYAKLQYTQMGDATMIMFEENEDIEYFLTEHQYNEYYISMTGEFLGNTYEEARAR